MDKEAIVLHFLRTECARKRAVRSKRKFVEALAKKLDCSPEEAVNIVAGLYRKNPLAKDLLNQLKEVWKKRDEVAEQRKELSYILLVNELVQAVNDGKKISLGKMRERTARRVGIGKSTLSKLLSEYSKTDKRFSELMILIEKIKEEGIKEEKERGKWWKKTKNSVVSRIPTDRAIVRNKIREFNKEEKEYESLLRRRLRKRRPATRRQKR